MTSLCILGNWSSTSGSGISILLNDCARSHIAVVLTSPKLHTTIFAVMGNALKLSLVFCYILDCKSSPQSF